MREANREANANGTTKAASERETARGGARGEAKCASETGVPLRVMLTLRYENNFVFKHTHIFIDHRSRRETTSSARAMAVTAIKIPATMLRAAAARQQKSSHTPQTLTKGNDEGEREERRAPATAAAASTENCPHTRSRPCIIRRENGQLAAIWMRSGGFITIALIAVSNGRALARFVGSIPGRTF